RPIPPASTLFPYTTRFRSESGFLETLSQGEELFCQLPRRVVLRPCAIKPPEPAQHGEELWRLTHLPTQLKGPGVCHFHLRGCRADRKSTRLNSSHRTISYA